MWVWTGTFYLYNLEKEWVGDIFMSISWNVRESTAEISRLMLNEISSHLTDVVNSVTGTIKKDIRDALTSAIESSPTWESLGDGILRGHFGLHAGTIRSRLQTILDTLVNSVEVKNTFKPSARGFTGGLQVTAIESSYNDLFVLSEASVVTKRPTLSKAIQNDPNPRTLPWLRWLLTFGDTGIVKGFDVKLGRGTGRSGLAVMIETDSVWSVPSQFASRGGKNFLTDAVESLTAKDTGGQLEQIIKKRITEAF